MAQREFPFVEVVEAQNAMQDYANLTLLDNDALYVYDRVPRVLNELGLIDRLPAGADCITNRHMFILWYFYDSMQELLEASASLYPLSSAKT
jgi:hypothetical protein